MSTSESPPAYGPSRSPSGPPSEFWQRDYTWQTTQQLHELSVDVGGLKEAVSNLKGDAVKQEGTLGEIKTTIDKMKGALYVAGAVLTLLLAVIAYLLDRGFENIVKALTSA